MDAAQATRALSPEAVADGLAAIENTYRRPDSAGVCVVDGFGRRVVVERGALEVHDGIGPHRRTRRYERATHGLRRVVIMNAAGIVSLDALRWSGSLGIAVLVLGGDGKAQLASTPRVTDDARLRRVQALALDAPYGLDVARWLIARKLHGQGGVALRLGVVHVAEEIGGLVIAAEEAGSLEELRGIEASAAALYFGTWTGRSECAPRFAAQDRRRVPAHWMRFEGRRSVLASANGNRRAERPANSILNYLYALLEAEAILACQAVGLDPGLGILHADVRGRQSLALDIMEPVRPEVDARVLDLLERRMFRKAEFTETSDGHVRLRAPLTHELAATMPHWAQSLAPVAEKVAHDLGAVMVGKYTRTTPLSGRNQRAAQAAIKARREATRRAAESTAARQQPSPSSRVSYWTCPDCGGAVTNTQHVRCYACIGTDPSQSPEIRGRRGRAIAARRRMAAEWDAAHGDEPYDPERFRREILPGLGDLKLVEIMAATRWSKSFASRVRAGRSVPHVSTWPALAVLGRSSDPR